MKTSFKKRIYEKKLSAMQKVVTDEEIHQWWIDF